MISEVDCRGVSNLALREFGRIDILVNNDGVAGGVGTAADVDMAQWNRNMDIYVTSMVQMSK